MIKKNQKIFNLLLFVIDAIILFFSLLLAYYIRFKIISFPVGEYLKFYKYFIFLLFIIPLYIGLYSIFKLYLSYRTASLLKEILNIMKANISGIFILMTILYFFNQNYSRIVFLLFFIFSNLLMFFERIVIRIILRFIRTKGYNIKHIIIIGANDLSSRFIKSLFRHKYLGYKIFALLDDQLDKGSFFLGAEVSGKIKDLDEILSKNLIDEIIIAIKIIEYSRIQEIIDICEKNGVRAKIIPDYYNYIPARPYIDQIDDLQLISMRQVPYDIFIYKAVKRVFDILIAIIAIILFSPFILLISVIIKLTSTGPVLFKQKRVGKNGKVFEMYKLRSMYPASDEVAATSWTTEDDLRKTNVGKYMRKYSIDELPQLFNVLKGEMSIVGPRPERPYFVEKFRDQVPRYMVKHQVPPGMTGWAQVNGWRGDTSIQKRIDHDIYYVENYNIFFDIKILFLTIVSGFINKNAY